MTQNIEVIISTLVMSHNNNKDEPNDRQISFMDKVEAFITKRKEGGAHRVYNVV